jgi:hypothetical protein
MKCMNFLMLKCSCKKRTALAGHQAVIKFKLNKIRGKVLYLFREVLQVSHLPVRSPSGATPGQSS